MTTFFICVTERIRFIKQNVENKNGLSGLEEAIRNGKIEFQTYGREGAKKFMIIVTDGQALDNITLIADRKSVR